MSSRPTSKFYQSVVFRLTLWYAAIFIVISIIAFVAFYMSLEKNLNKRSRTFLQDKVEEFSKLVMAGKAGMLNDEFRRETQSIGVNNVYYSFLDAGGRTLISSNSLHWANLKPNKDLIRMAVRDKKPMFEVVKLPHFRHKVRIIYDSVGSGKILLIAMGLKYEENLLYGMQIIFTRVMLLILCLSILGSWWILTRAMSRVSTVTNTAMSISSKTLDRRVPVSSRADEIDRLAEAFNNMLARIRTLINALKDVTDNIAHDLKTPITRIRLIAESRVSNGEENTNIAPSEYQELSGAIIEECDKLIGMINSSLELRALEYDRGIVNRNLSRINLSEMLHQACDIFQPVAEDNEITITLDVDSEVECFIRADKDLLQRAFANIIDNAIKYTASGGMVRVVLKRKGDSFVVEISDNGAGISQESLPHIFEKFYRGDLSRSACGSGLGLALTKSIIEAHRGSVSVESQEGKGTKFTVVLSA